VSESRDGCSWRAECGLHVASDLLNRLKAERYVIDANALAQDTQAGQSAGVYDSETQSSKKRSGRSQRRHLRPQWIVNPCASY
jgi:phosphoheptose isomerase